MVVRPMGAIKKNRGNLRTKQGDRHKHPKARAWRKRDATDFLLYRERALDAYSTARQNCQLVAAFPVSPLLE